MSRISTDGPDVPGVPSADSTSDAPVFMSRREARAAREAAQGKPVVAAATVVSTPAAALPAVAADVHETISPEVVVTSEIAVPQIPVAPVAIAQEPAPVRYTPAAPPSSYTVKAKLKRVRKSPFHAVASMAVIGGLFVVTGLPAYGQSDLVSDAGTLASVAAVADALPASVQSVTVSAELDFPELERDQFEATSPEDLAVIQQQDAIASANALYAASGAQTLGDDYPWPTAGTSLSPLNYYYRQCTDFVAWRLNRDVGSFAAPFRWAWADLTPNGGDAYQWKSAWDAHGWTVSDVPVAGSVAWFGWDNHVSYVKQVNEDGSVLLEEYNYVALSYGQRTIPASEVEAFLYPPGQ